MAASCCRGQSSAQFVVNIEDGYHIRVNSHPNVHFLVIKSQNNKCCISTHPHPHTSNKDLSCQSSLCAWRSRHDRLTGCHVWRPNVSAANAAACAPVHTPHPDHPPTQTNTHTNTPPPPLPPNSLLAWRCWWTKFDSVARSPAQVSGFDSCPAKCRLLLDPLFVRKWLWKKQNVK